MPTSHIMNGSPEQPILGARARHVMTAVALTYAGALWLGIIHRLEAEHRDPLMPSMLAAFLAVRENWLAYLAAWSARVQDWF